MPMYSSKNVIYGHNFIAINKDDAVYRAARKYYINDDMQGELYFLLQGLAPDSGIQWSSLIAHRIKKRPNDIGTEWMTLFFRI
jgi:hypothetical protein